MNTDIFLKLKNLSNAQVSKLESYRDKWFKESLNTAPANRKKAEECIRARYKYTGEKLEAIVWVDSIFQLHTVYAMYLLLNNKLTPYVDALKMHPADTRFKKILTNMNINTKLEFDYKTIGLCNIPKVSDGGVIIDKLVNVFVDSFLPLFKGEYNNLQREEKQAFVKTLLFTYNKEIRESYPELLKISIHGNHDGEWWGIFEFLLKEMKQDIEEKLFNMNYSYHAGWAILDEKIAILCERPTIFSINYTTQRTPQLHSDIGPAVAYADGFRQYFIREIPIEPWVFESPELLTPDLIDNEKNAELQQIYLQRYGFDRYMQSGNISILHKDVDEAGRERVLFKKVVNVVDEPYVAVSYFNWTPEPDGTYKQYFSRVHPELRALTQDPMGRYVLGDTKQKLTCHNAIASTFGKLGKEYHPDIQT